jgi:hypothetical protein
MLKDNKGAIQDYSKASALWPNYDGAYYQTGIAYQNLNDNISACIYWRMAAELGEQSAYESIQRYCN